MVKAKLIFRRETQTGWMFGQATRDSSYAFTHKRRILLPTKLIFSNTVSSFWRCLAWPTKILRRISRWFSNEFVAFLFVLFGYTLEIWVRLTSLVESCGMPINKASKIYSSWLGSRRLIAKLTPCHAQSTERDQQIIFHETKMDKAMYV